MPTVSQGSEVTIDLAAADAYQVAIADGGDAYVDLLSGAPGSPYASPRLRAPTTSKVFGPYGVAARIRIRAIAGAVTYTPYKAPQEVAYNPATGSMESGGSPVSGAGIGQYPVLNTIPGLVAFWDFSEVRAPYVSKAGTGGPLPLRNGPGSRVAKGTAGPLGQSVVFNGTSDYLYIPAEEVGQLNIGANGGNAVTVLAWWKRTDSTSVDFIAGCWDEAGLSRQYGLFVDLATYGGVNKVCMHVSRNGGPTPGYPYSRDYSNSNSTDPSRQGEWIAGSYDGAAARSYIEGLFEPYPSYTDGLGNTYAKNPYVFPDGLNTNPCSFHVGANQADPAWNYAKGELACLAVFNRALTQSEIAAFQAGLNPAAQGFKHTMFSWDQTVSGVNFIYGCGAYRGATAIDESATNTGVFLRTSTGSPLQHFIYRGATSPAGIALFTVTNLAPDLTTDNLKTITWQMANANTGDAVRFAIKIGSAWYATEATFAVTAASASGADWSLAETKSITFTKAAASWRDVTLTPGSTLTLAGAARGSDLPSGAITGIGIYSPGVPTGNVRFRNFEIITL